MSRCYVRELQDGDAVEEVFLVRDKQVRRNKNGNAYLSMELDDRTGSIGGRFWNVTEVDAQRVSAGDFLLVKGKVQNFQGQLQLIINAFQPADPERLQLVDFIPATDQDVEALLAELRASLMRVTDPVLHAVGEAFLLDDDLMERWRHCPAGVRNHHAYLGGLLENVVNLLRVAERIADLYPSLNLDLLKLGIFLHDIGKLRELAYQQGFRYTDEGQLVGHLVIGVEMLQEKLPAIEELLGAPPPAEVLLRLKHLILSHHGTYEFGSPKLPMTPEAIALHHLDNLDAKVHGFSRMITDDANGGSIWTAYDVGLGRRIYKGPPLPGANGQSSA